MAVFCSNCGKSLGDEARFCSGCGRPIYATQPPVFVQTRLIRPREGRMVAGVCQGLANNYHWDVVWVRVITVLATIFSSGAGLIAYIVFWLVMPEEPLALPPVTTYTQTNGS
ncbi:PspC domain-containing protein [Acidobacterium sp. S8]|jgi:phage shock protein C|uniref:PspC domain-containing protein n=1 Tax=Acidobacterium sp. S8 TaxID=1641854 RepID=UPI00131BBDD3|nr:PspC domain-containing protein [Acidobacterium sp. S8]